MPAATPEGTNRFVTQFIDQGISATSFPLLGRTGLKISVLGFGTYRVNLRASEHEESLRKAISMGCNLIDTSSNYSNGESESLIGNVLKDLFAESLKRDEIVVVSKVGYVQGKNLELAREREAQKHPIPDMVKYLDECWHCIHPDFIEDQLNRSLERLQLEKIDVFLLHNPEYFLMDELNKHPDGRLDQIRDIFYDRITRAFRKLEEEVEAGRIAYYGVSSNNFGHGIHEREATSLSQMWDIACHVAKDKNGNPYQNHFAVAQLPANLLETNPMTNPNCEDDQTAVEFAKEKDIAVLTNRPLNAIQGNQMIRLADLVVKKHEKTPTAQMKAVVALEEEFVQTIAPHFKTDAGGPDPTKLFFWGQELSHAKLKSFGLEQWKHIEFQVIRPQVSHLSQAMDQQLQGELRETWSEWRDKYIPSLVKLLEIIRSDFSKRSKKQITAISEKVDELIPKSIRKETLSRKALALLVNTPGITCVLNGMRKPEYVEDSMGVMRLERFKVSRKSYELLLDPKKTQE